MIPFQSASLSFDASVIYMCLAWGAGTRLYVATREDILSGERLTRVLKENRITVAGFTPSRLLATMTPAQLDGVIKLFVGGEKQPGIGSGIS